MRLKPIIQVGATSLGQIRYLTLLQRTKSRNRNRLLRIPNPETNQGSNLSKTWAIFPVLEASPLQTACHLKWKSLLCPTWQMEISH
jgi:hypothetical protein